MSRGKQSRSPEEIAAVAMKKRKTKVPYPSRRSYTIRFGILKPQDFSDWALVWRHPGYSRPPAPTPNNGEHGAKPLRREHKQYQNMTAFYDSLKESVAREGIRNPVFALCYEDGLYVRYGCSRVMTAKQLGVEIPVVIADYTDNWEHLMELKSENHIRSKYKDQPALIEIHKDWMRIDGCK